MGGARPPAEPFCSTHPPAPYTPHRGRRAVWGFVARRLTAVSGECRARVAQLVGGGGGVARAPRVALRRPVRCCRRRWRLLPTTRSGAGGGGGGATTVVGDGGGGGGGGLDRRSGVAHTRRGRRRRERLGRRGGVAHTRRGRRRRRWWLAAVEREGGGGGGGGEERELSAAMRSPACTTLPAAASTGRGWGGRKGGGSVACRGPLPLPSPAPPPCYDARFQSRGLEDGGRRVQPRATPCAGLGMTTRPGWGAAEAARPRAGPPSRVYSPAPGVGSRRPRCHLWRCWPAGEGRRVRRGARRCRAGASI